MANGRKGFEVGFDSTRKILRIRIWGGWDAEFTQKFGHTLRERLCATCRDGQDYTMLIDGRDFVAETNGVPEMIRQHIAASGVWGIAKIAYLQAQTGDHERCRYLPDSGKMPQYACFTMEEQALTWLLDSPHP